VSTFYSCRNPTTFSTPRYKASDKTAKTVTIDWSKPGYDGGCPITGYRLIRDNGPGTEINIEVSSLTQTDPNLIQHVVDLTTGGVVGTIYKFKMQAYNKSGFIESNALSVALASLPSKPTTAPTSDPAITRQDRIGIKISAFDSTLNGGSEILLYEV
jgi:hypothetical protein